MIKRQKLRSTTYRKLKANKECVERKCAASLPLFLRKKYVDEVKCKDEDAECASELQEEEHGENVNKTKRI